MQDKRYIICGNAPTSGIEENPERDLRLRLWGKDGPDKITLRIEDIHKKMSKDVPDSFQDLLEIATYVYCADQAIPRGADDVDSFGHGWRRNLHFIIPVRNPDFWNGEEIQQALCSTLGFLSDDSYHFEFTKLQEAQAFQGYPSRTAFSMATNSSSVRNPKCDSFFRAERRPLFCRQSWIKRSMRRSGMSTIS